MADHSGCPMAHLWQEATSKSHDSHGSEYKIRDVDGGKDENCCDSYPKKQRVQKVPPCHEADYVVVGLGGAGAAVARRLSCKWEVIGLESGTKDDDDPLIFNPLNSGILVPQYINKFFMPNGHTQVSDGERFWPYVGGRVFGGGTAVNGMQYVESTPDYWNEIAAIANDPTWGYANVKSVYKDIQNYHGAGLPCLHGDDGPVDIRAGVTNLEAAEAYVAASNEVTGDKTVIDYNNPKTPNGSYINWQLFQTPGKARVSSSTAYLDNVRKFCECNDGTSPVKCREVYLSKSRKLRIYGKSTVNYVIFERTPSSCEEYGSDKPVPRATAVSTLVDGQEVIFRARKGVILCAGFNSPLILQRSGIGHAEELKKLGIKSVHHNPQVGENLFNHSLYVLTGLATDQPVPGTVTDAEALYTGGAFAADPTTPGDNRAFQYIGLASAPFAFTIVLQPLVPKSSGFVKLYNSDPNKPPYMQFRYLNTQSEIDSAVAGVKIMRDTLIKMGLTPTVDLSTEEQLLEFININIAQSYHWVGACSMNRDARLGVVDGDLKVHGVKGLYVADDSILPRVPDGNTAAPAILIGNILVNKLLDCPIVLPHRCKHYNEKESVCVDKCCRQPKAKTHECVPPVEDRELVNVPAGHTIYGRPQLTGGKGGGQCQRP